VISEDDVVQGQQPRHTVHVEGLLHREVDLFVINHYGLLLQRREDSGKWNHFGGHVEPKDTVKTNFETWKNAALRELVEELYHGQDRNKELAVELAADLEEVGCYRRHTGMGSKENNNNRLARIFLLRKDVELNRFTPDPGEVAEIRYFRGAALARLLEDPEGVRTGTLYVLSRVPYLNMLLASRCLLWG
jgi:isopentenyldiphosphate isomerase